MLIITHDAESTKGKCLRPLICCCREALRWLRQPQCRMEVLRSTGVLPTTSCSASLRYSWELQRCKGDPTMQERWYACDSSGVRSGTHWSMLPETGASTQARTCLSNIFAVHTLQDRRAAREAAHTVVWTATQPGRLPRSSIMFPVLNARHRGVAASCVTLRCCPRSAGPRRTPRPGHQLPVSPSIHALHSCGATARTCGAHLRRWPHGGLSSAGRTRTLGGGGHS